MMKYLSVLLAVITLDVGAATLDSSLIQTTGEPVIGGGRFYGYQTSDKGPGDLAFTNALALARSSHAPLVVIWSNEGCHYCDDFTDNLNANNGIVSAWLAANRAVFAFFKDNSGDYAPTWNHKPKACYDAWNFAAQTCGSRPPWPMVGFYYEKTDGTTITWKHGTTEYKTFAWLQKQFTDWCAENSISLDFNRSGEFSVSGTEGDRYEVEPGTTEVGVTLVRSEVKALFAATNREGACWPGEKDAYYSTNVVWLVGEREKTISVPMKDHVEFPADQSEIELRLADEYGVVYGTTPIVCRSALKNGAANPLWIGETFDFGEWTMDLDAATQKVATAEGPAFTVVSLQGSKWCPDCANVDRNFLELEDAASNNVFRAWAASNQVALVSIDIPNFNGPAATNYASPALLSRTAYSTTLARPKEYPESGADIALTSPMLRSGVGYLSRKGVDDETAAKVLARNHFLVSKNTDEGGFHRPEDGNANRTGVPIFVVLRKDGTVAARLTRWASKSPMASAAENVDTYLKRFDEMLAIAQESGEHADPAEIGNNYVGAGAVEIAADGGRANGELCNADFQDVYRLVGAFGGLNQKIIVRGETDAEVRLSLVEEAHLNEKGKVDPLKSSTGKLSEGVELDWILPEDGDWYVMLEGSNIVSTAFAMENEKRMNFHAYELTAAALYVPTETSANGSAPAGGSNFVMRVASNTLYRVAGLAETLPVGIELIGAAPAPMTGNLYRAAVNGDLVFTTASVGGAFGYQIWKPGEIAFTHASDWTSEYAGTGIVKVVRMGGASGAVTAQVKCIAGDAASPSGRYAWTDREVTWSDGESGEKELGFPVRTVNGYQEDESFTLAMTLVGETSTTIVAPSNCVFAVRDTDAPCLRQSTYAVSALRNFTTLGEFEAVNLREGARVTISKATGSASLPAGVKLAYDKTTGSVKLSGVPTKAGVYEYTFTLTEYSGGRRYTGFETTIVITVEDPAETNPLLAEKRPRQSLALFVADDQGKPRLAGTLDVAITSKGRISAKYSGLGARKISFSGNWGTLCAVGADEGVAGTTLTAKQGAQLELSMDCGGRLKARLWGEAVDCGRLQSTAVGSGNPLIAEADWPVTGVFDGFAGYYTVVMPQTGAVESVSAPLGSAFVTLKLTSKSLVKSGTVRYAGVLPDGAGVSGSATLRNLDDEKSSIELPLFKRAGRNAYGWQLKLLEGADQTWNATAATDREVVFADSEANPYCLHTETGWNYLTEHEAYGVYYPEGICADEIYDGFYLEKFGADNPFELTFDCESAAASERYGALCVMPGVIRAEAKKFVLDRQAGMSFSCVQRTGVFRGRARIVFESGDTLYGTYRGVLAPGWINSCECGVVAPERPLGGGTLYYRDTVDGKAVTRSLKVTLEARK